MKKLILISAILFTFFQIEAQSFHGKKISARKKAIEASQLANKMAETSSLKTRVTGIVEDVCQAKGCWMKITTDNGKAMRVTFKDYAFFVPKDIAGKRVTFEGIAQKSETSVDELKHYAQDAGKSAEEISKINQPEYVITFEADGVIVDK